MRKWPSLLLVALGPLSGCVEPGASERDYRPITVERVAVIDGEALSLGSISDYDMSVDGKVAMVDFLQARLVVFDSLGSLLWEHRKRGEGPFEFIGPGRVRFLASGAVVVLDTPNQRLLMFDPEGHPLDALPITNMSALTPPRMSIHNGMLVLLRHINSGAGLDREAVEVLSVDLSSGDFGNGDPGPWQRWSLPRCVGCSIILNDGKIYSYGTFTDPETDETSGRFVMSGGDGGPLVTLELGDWEPRRETVGMARRREEGVWGRLRTFAPGLRQAQTPAIRLDLSPGRMLNGWSHDSRARGVWVSPRTLPDEPRRFILIASSGEELTRVEIDVEGDEAIFDGEVVLTLTYSGYDIPSLTIHRVTNG